ncbi:hypothetical protein ACGFI9_32270 [Micromonospora sp. NPDC048930]|uniref:hypothetical protein n=1 Tax=Micromonospora sp. NPDC048930 TaxID=3364261 RepID=UPI003719DB5B
MAHVTSSRCHKDRVAGISRFVRGSRERSAWPATARREEAVWEPGIDLMIDELGAKIVK